MSNAGIADLNPYGKLSSRALALYLDFLVLSVVFYPLEVLIGAAVHQYSVPIMVGYFTLLEFSPLQGTLGKYWRGLKSETISGERAGVFFLLLRGVLKTGSFAFLGLPFLLAALSSRKQTLHDLCCRTVVVERTGHASSRSSLVPRT